MWINLRQKKIDSQIINLVTTDEPCCVEVKKDKWFNPKKKPTEHLSCHRYLALKSKERIKCLLWVVHGNDFQIWNPWKHENDFSKFEILEKFIYLTQE